MAISGVSSPSYRENWENNGGIYANETDETEGTEGATHVWNAVFEDKKSSAIDTESFLALIVAQMTNQDFMNPMDDTAMVTQMVQMNTMQMMQEMATQTKTSYVMGMVGKTVTAARISVSGELLKETGPVQKVTLTNNEFAVYVNGKRFTLEQIMEIGTTEGLGGTDKVDGTDGSNSTDTDEDALAKKKEYLNSLLGRQVSITVSDEYGSYEVEGIVEKVSTRDGKFQVYVNDKWYDMDDISEVGDKVTSGGNTDDETPEVPDVDDSTETPDVTDPDPGTETPETPPVETIPDPEDGGETDSADGPGDEDDEAVGETESVE